MKDEHIIDRLGSGPLAELGPSELERIERHAAGCESCRREYSVARLTDDLVRVRAAETVEPSPFFQTRVMAAWRERSTGDLWGFARIWRSAGALVSSMAATVAVLVALTFAMPGTTAPAGSTDTQVAQASSYSAEDVIFESDSYASGSEGQAATTILDGDDEER